MNALAFKRGIKEFIAPLFAPLYRGRGSILMFHRILSDDGRPRVHTKALEVTPERLEEIILFFKKKKYDFIKMEQVEDYLKKKEKGRFVVFTFDDGYVDNYTVAYPIFKRHGIPFTIYITTNMPDHKMILWHYMLEEMMLMNKALKLELSGKIQSFDLSDLDKKELVYNELRRYLIDLSKDDRIKKIEEWFLNQEGDLYNRVKKESMTWEQIIELSKDPLLEINAHSISHPSLSTLSEEEMIHEVNGSKKILENNLGKKVAHFAYPFGSKDEIGEREVKILSETDFKTSVTTREANILKEHGKYLHALPRIYVGPKMKIKDLNEFTNGTTFFVRNSTQRLITV
jgi:peptidoglycan/xylan/chitin deacetylase (PgdA/CDA1 family)